MSEAVAVENEGQRPGCLPVGFGMDSYLTPEEFAVWQRITPRHARSLFWGELPGVDRSSRKHARLHVRTYLEKTFKRAYA
jgi:hypothetical protein